jgi:hypothetical protein
MRVIKQCVERVKEVKQPMRCGEGNKQYTAK